LSSRTVVTNEWLWRSRFSSSGRRIDILAVDGDGALVVIELKVSRGHDQVIGQILWYLGWIKANLAEEGQGVRGIIIA